MNNAICAKSMMRVKETFIAACDAECKLLCVCTVIKRWLEIEKERDEDQNTHTVNIIIFLGCLRAQRRLRLLFVIMTAFMSLAEYNNGPEITQTRIHMHAFRQASRNANDVWKIDKNATQ